MIERPTSLKVLCGIWFVLGVFESLRCLLGFYDLIRFQIADVNSSYPVEITGMIPLVVAGGYALTLVQAALAVLTTVSAIYLWKLRSWARTGLEAVSWIGLFLVGGGGLFFMYAFLEMTSRMPAAARDQIDWMGWVALALISMLSAAHGVSIGVLRGRKVREAIAGALADEAVTEPESRLPYQVPSVPGG